ncbi:MAG: sulfatase-like hydrolase/transferase, partial [Myxococcota bacterium]
LQQGRAQEKSSGFRVTLPEDLNQAVEALLPTFADSEIFAYFHYLQPHKPYDPPPRFRALLEPEAEDCTCAGTPCPCGSLDWDTLHERFAAANQAGRASASTIGHLKTRYRANIRYVDAGVGALLEGMRRQGLYDESLIVLLADHGEAFFDHGHFGHNRTLYDDMVRIPLMMKFPRAAGVAPRRIDALVETVDVLPTLFDFLGFPIPVNFEGHSLWPLISDPEFEPDSAHQEVILATNRLDQHAIRVGPYKYIAHLDGREELYDVEADPGELHDLSEAEPQRARTLRARLAAAVDFESVKPTPARNTLRSDPEMEQLLEVLGYVRGDDEATEGSAASPGEPPAPVRD